MQQPILTLTAPSEGQEKLNPSGVIRAHYMGVEYSGTRNENRMKTGTSCLNRH